jgi:hypothetical protein
MVRVVRVAAAGSRYWRVAILNAARRSGRHYEGIGGLCGGMGVFDGKGVRCYKV